MNTEQNNAHDDSTQRTEHALRIACKNRCIIDSGLVQEIVRDGLRHFEADQRTNTLNPTSMIHPFLTEYIEYKLRTYSPEKIAINAKAIKEEQYLGQLEAAIKAGDMKKYRALRSKSAA